MVQAELDFGRNAFDIFEPTKAQVMQSCKLTDQQFFEEISFTEDKLE